MKPNHIKDIALVAVGAAGGFFLTSFSKGSQSAEPFEKAQNTEESAAKDMRLHGQSESLALRTRQLTEKISGYDHLSSSAFSAEFKRLKDASRQERALLIPLMFAAWAEKDPASALIASKDLVGLKDEAVAIVLSIWSSSEPSDAAEFYKLNEKGLFSRNYLEPWNQVSGSSIVATSLAQNSVDDAIAWAKQLNDIADKEQAMKAIFSELGSSDPEKAVSMLDALPQGEREAAMRALAVSWTSLDAGAAVDWINSLEDYAQSQVLPHLIEGLAKSDPEQAGDYIEYIDGNRDEVIGYVLRPWMEENPQSAANWLLSETTREEQISFMRSVVGKWIDQDLDSARTWVINQEKGNAKDIAVEAYVASTASGQEEYRELIDMARNEIGDQTLRERAINTALVQWTRRDKESAQAFAETSGLLSDEALADYFYQVNAQTPLD